MNTFFSSAVEALGWALVHCLWQGTAVALGLAVLLRAMRRASAQVRYAMATAALGVLVAGFAGTVAWCWPEVASISMPGAGGANGAPSATTAPAASAAPKAGGVVAAGASAVQPGSEAKGNRVTAGTAKTAAAAAAARMAGLQVPVAAQVISLSERFRMQLPWAVAFWAAGVLFFSARFLTGWLSVRRWVRRAAPVGDDAWKLRFAELAAALRVSRPVRLLVSAALTSPAVIGWLKPVVLVPAGIFTGLPAAQLEAILAHELAHIRRHDYLVNLVQNLVETLLFFHPGVWWISRQMRNEREHCCDALAADSSGGALSYAKALTALEEMRGTAPALALAATGGSLLDRVRRLLGVREEKSAAWPLGILMISVAAVLFSFTVVKAAKPEEATLQSAEITNGTYSSYCVYKGREIRFVFVSKRDFEYKPGADLEHGSIGLARRQGADRLWISFSPETPGGDVVVVRFPGNLVFRYDLARSRVLLVDLDQHQISPVLRLIPVKLEPITSAEILTKGATEVANWLAAADEAQKWEQTRVMVPESEYKTGKAVDPNDQSIIWGEPNEVGLRLGIRGLAQNAVIPAGQNLPVKQFIRNDGRETLRLSPTGFFNEGIAGEMVGANGEKTVLKSGYPWPMFFIRIRLETGQFAELQSSPLQTVLANNDGSPGAPQRPYASGFLVSPGEYTLRLAHRVGQFIGKPMNAVEGDPRLAPGLGEWRGVLQAAPITLRMSGPTVGTGKPGTVAELVGVHRIQFQKGQLVLSHPRGGLQGPGTFAVDKDGNWPTPGGIWKIADANGEYVAAWDEGSARLWYVDGTGIQRLDIGGQFADAGHWSMAEGAGELANMPDGVRKALGLPERKKAEPGADASEPIRGLSLKDVPRTADKSKLAELYEPYPENPRQFRQRADVLDLPLYGAKGSPVLLVPKGRVAFYVTFEGQTIGPIAGNPVEHLGLAQMLRKKLAETPNREGIAALEKMMKRGNEPMRDLACRMLTELKEPAGPFDYEGLFGAAIDCVVDGNLNFEANDGVNHLRGLYSAARDKWEKRRVLLPENAYVAGEKMPENPKIAWGEADKDGMRLGVLGVEGGERIAPGAHLPTEFFLRNDGKAAVKLSCPERIKGGLEMWLEGKEEKKFKVGYKFDDGAGSYRHVRLEPGQTFKIAGAEIEFFGTEEEIRKAAHRQGFEHSPRIGAPPGVYAWHLNYRVGSEEYAGLALASQGPEKVEWTGLLEMKPAKLTVEPR